MTVTPTGDKESWAAGLIRFVSRLRSLITPVFGQTERTEEEIREREEAQKERNAGFASDPQSGQGFDSSAQDDRHAANEEDAAE